MTQLKCAQESSRTKTPFWTVSGGVRIDFLYARGLLAQPDGSLHFFSYCGGQHCATEFEMRWCLKLKPDDLECEQWANDPQRK